MIRVDIKVDSTAATKDRIFTSSEHFLIHFLYKQTDCD